MEPAPRGNPRAAEGAELSSASRESDGSLVDRTREGDSTAFEELVRLYSPSVFRVAAGMVGPDDAEDVVQDVFMIAHQRLADFEGRSTLKTWLCGIAANQSLARLRKRRRWGWLGFSSEGVEQSNAAAEGRSAESLTEGSETDAHVRDAIQKLPVEQRAVLLLRVYEELTFPEIASALGIRVPTAESRMARARERLRDLLGHLEPKGIRP